MARSRKNTGSFSGVGALFIIGVLFLLLRNQLILPAPDESQQAVPTEAPLPSPTATTEMVFDTDWIDYVGLVPLSERSDVPTQPPSSVDNPGWDWTKLAGHYTPVLLKFQSRPVMVTSWDQIPEEYRSNVAALWQQLHAGIQYESWQYINACELQGIPPENCRTSRYYNTSMIPEEAFLAAITVQIYGGLPWYDVLGICFMESNCHAPPYATSSAGAQGPYQMKDHGPTGGWSSFQFWAAWAGGDVQNLYDATFSAANMALDIGITPSTLTESDYVYHFRGEPCVDMSSCKYPNRARTAGYNDYMWNNHPAEAMGAYRLNRQFLTIWRTYFP